MNAQSKIEAPKVYAAINAVMAGLAEKGIAKSRENTQGQGFKFRGIDDVLNTLSGLLVEHKLVMLPRVLNRDGEVRQSGNGKPIFVAFCEVEYDLVSVEDGSTHVIRTVGEAMDMSDKASNKAMSAAYKYAAIQAFCIPTEGDNDADAHTHDVAPANDAMREPAAREKLEGPHTSKTALRKAINDVITKVRAAQSNEEIDAIQKDNIATIKQANRDWPILLTGDPNISEDIGLKGAVEVRRADLSADDGQFKMLIDSMKECDSSQMLANWMATNESLIEQLDGAEGRKFEMALQLHESALKQVATVAAG